MLDFRLQVFYTVAKRLNFTRAASELYITQPAVTKHIRELENHYKVSLFERRGNKKISLTPAGSMLLKHAEQLLEIYRNIDFNISMLNQQHSGVLRIGASTTVAQYVIPAVLARFHQSFGDVKISLLTGNTEDIERALVQKEIELGIIEGISRHPELKYEKYIDDELVLVCTSNNPLIKKDSIKAVELADYPLVLREPGSGTLEVIAHALKQHDIKLRDLKIEMQLGSTESIKTYMAHSHCLAILSVHAILKELKHGEFRVIDVKELSIERSIYFIHPHGQPPGIANLFMRFATGNKPH